jgi:Protein of unknown function (DUF3592)
VRLVGAVFLGVGGLMLVLALLLYASERQFLSNASHATGTVIQLVEHRTRRGSRSWTPRVAFRDGSGSVRVFEGSVGSFPAANRAGDVVQVIYGGNKADVDSTLSRWLICWVLTGMGLVFLGVGYFQRRS